MYSATDWASVITMVAGVLISIVFEQIPLLRKWWREDLEANYSQEAADTIRLAVQVVLVLVAAVGSFYAAEAGYLPGPAPEDKVFVPAVITVLLSLLANQGTFHVNRRYWGGAK